MDNTQQIQLKIHDESDLFTPFDPEQKMISEEVNDYLVRNYQNKFKKAKEKYDLHIISDVPVDEECVKP